MNIINRIRFVCLSVRMHLVLAGKRGWPKSVNRKIGRIYAHPRSMQYLFGPALILPYFGPNPNAIGKIIRKNPIFVTIMCVL